jgi:hypothetical protein
MLLCCFISFSWRLSLLPSLLCFPALHPYFLALSFGIVMSQDLQHEFLWYQAQITAHLASASASAAAAATTSAAAAATASPGDSLVLALASASPPCFGFSTVHPGPTPLPPSMALLEAATHVIPAVARLARPLCPSSAPPPSSAIREHWLDSSLAESSRRKYRGPWEEWCAFAASHWISALPPDEYAAEQFIIENAETTRSVASVETAVASINHFCVRSKLTSPFLSPAFGLILRGIRRKCGRLAVPRQPFTAGYIVMRIASSDFIRRMLTQRTRGAHTDA